MAAVIREIFTDNPYFSAMRRGSATREEEPSVRVTYDPAYESVPRAQGGHDGEHYEQRSESNSSIGNERGGYASQQHFDPRTQSSHWQQGSRQPMPNHYETTHLADRSLPNAGIPRSAYSSNDLTRYANNTAGSSAPVINVRDLAHIESFAAQHMRDGGESGRQSPKYEISGMPIGDVIEMVAALLTKITTTNDRQHEHLHRPLPHTADSSSSGRPPSRDGEMDGLTQSVLAFHGKNVPSITVLSYLSRIHKYCPLTYEVFLSLLVYFDRMTERVNPSTFDQDDRPGSERGIGGREYGGVPDEGPHEEPRTPISLSQGSSMEDVRQHQTHNPPEDGSSEEEKRARAEVDLHNYFVVDSFNIHRLVIAGVTCASKFFSDTFYTNSRYAKVSRSDTLGMLRRELTRTGWRSATTRTKPPGTTIPPPE